MTDRNDEIAARLGLAPHELKTLFDGLRGRITHPLPQLLRKGLIVGDLTGLHMWSRVTLTAKGRKIVEKAIKAGWKEKRNERSIEFDGW